MKMVFLLRFHVSYSSSSFFSSENTPDWMKKILKWTPRPVTHAQTNPIRDDHLLTSHKAHDYSNDQSEPKREENREEGSVSGVGEGREELVAARGESSEGGEGVVGGSEQDDSLGRPAPSQPTKPPKSLEDITSDWVQLLSSRGVNFDSSALSSTSHTFASSSSTVTTASSSSTSSSFSQSSQLKPTLSSVSHGLFGRL